MAVTERKDLAEPGRGRLPARAPARPFVRFDAVTKRFGAFTAVDRLTLDIHEGEFFALLGPSGCGKSTLLRMLAGFEPPDEGRVLLAGEDLAGVPPYRRPVNMMFQNYALFPHLSVARNVAFGLRQDGLPRAEIDARVAEMLGLVQLQDLAQRKPAQLSGGQRQRVALARALYGNPFLVILDEPNSNLDNDGELALTQAILTMRARGSIVIIVAHRPSALASVDQVLVMAEGRMQAFGPKDEVLARVTRPPPVPPLAVVPQKG